MSGSSQGNGNSADLPRICVIGPAGAGKSSLLGAIARAAEVQEKALGARITDVTGSLRGLRDRVYRQAGGNSGQEHRIRIEPIEGDTVVAARSWDLVLVEGEGAGQLGRADAVVFVLDVAADDEATDRQVTEFGMFLDRFRKERGHRADEPLLPVALALTQCDRLVKAGDSRAVWSERLEMRKEEIEQQFNDRVRNQPGFGSISLSTAAVAVRPPAVANSGERADEPIGVAELFRDLLGATRAHAEKKARGELGIRRLVVAAGLVAAAVALFAGLSSLLRNTFEASPAKAALTAYRGSEGPAPVGHLAAPIESKIERLQAISEEPSFAKLSESDRAFVSARLEELKSYRLFTEALSREVAPGEARSVDELNRIESTLRSTLTLPSQHASTWATSDAANKRELWLQQIPAIKTAVSAATATIDARRQTIDKLFVLGPGPTDWPGWSRKVDETLASGNPVKPDEALTIPHGSGPALTMKSILSYPEIAKSVERLNESTRRLGAFRSIVAVVGLLPEAGPSLRLPEGFNAEQAPQLWSALLAKYPDLPSWGSPDIPDAGLAAVQSAARAAYAKLVPSGRSLVRSAYGSPNDGPESAARWRTAGERLGNMPSMKAWNDLAKLALRLAGQNTDPMAEFQAFVRKDEFAFEAQAVDLIVSGASLTPSGSWTLFIQRPGSPVVKKAFKAPDDPKGERIRFTVADSKSAKIRAGDIVWAELSVTDAAKDDLQLTWWANGVRSKLYQFDRLTRQPRLHRIDQKSEEGRLAEGVRLEFLPPGSLPVVPDLMPEMP